MNQEQQRRSNKPIRKFVGYTALAVAATPVVFGLYTFGLAANYAFKNPKKTLLGSMAAASILYGVHTGVPQKMYTALSEQTSVASLSVQQNNPTSRRMLDLEEHIIRLSNENLALKQDPFRPVVIEQQKNNPYVLGALGLGLFGLGAGTTYFLTRNITQRRNRRPRNIDAIVNGQLREGELLTRPKIRQR